MSNSLDQLYRNHQGDDYLYLIEIMKTSGLSSCALPFLASQDYKSIFPFWRPPSYLLGISFAWLSWITDLISYSHKSFSDFIRNHQLRFWKWKQVLSVGRSEDWSRLFTPCFVKPTATKQYPGHSRPAVVPESQTDIISHARCPQTVSASTGGGGSYCCEDHFILWTTQTFNGYIGIKNI